MLMTEQWKEMLASLNNNSASYWRERLEIAEKLIEAFQTGQIIETTPTIQKLLRILVDDPKWEVRKVIANGLNLIVDEVFDDLSARLLGDVNSFVKRSAEQSYAMRRRDHRNNNKREAVDRQLANRMARLRDKHGPDITDEIIAISDTRFNQLAGTIAHDLRSILTHLQPAASRLKGILNGETDDTFARSKTDRIVDGLAFMDRCVSDMERYTEVLPVKHRTEDLAEVLKVACDMAAKNIDELGFNSRVVALQLNVPADTRCRISRHLFILAVVNLVKNAYESFMERQKHLRRGEISITVCRGNEDVRITIHDNGMGMAAEDLNELASGIPRRRNKAKRRSTGFGVPIARRYIEAHGGSLVFDSVEDVGTTVTITLPCEQSRFVEGEL